MTVCGPPKCTTTARLHLVRGAPWLQAEKHDPAGADDDGHDHYDGHDHDNNCFYNDNHDGNAEQGIEVCRIGLMFPIYSISYILCPWISFSQVHVTFFIAVPIYFILIDDILFDWMIFFSGDEKAVSEVHLQLCVLLLLPLSLDSRLAEDRGHHGVRELSCKKY